MSTLLELKKKEIYRTLEMYNGNKTKAAEHLDMSLRSLRDLTNSDPMFHRFKNDVQLERPQVMSQYLPQAQQSQTVVIEKEPIPEIFDVKRVVSKLENLMDQVTETDKSIVAVNAACQCAGRITEILRLQLDVHKAMRKR